MENLHLIVGNKNYSSWSMRPWVALRHAGIPFRETTIWLDAPDAAQRKLSHSPAGRVPILEHGHLVVWDSLAICEYGAEQFAKRGRWPAERAARARARALCAEMHSGFLGLRSQFPMNFQRHKARATPMPDAVRADLTRITEIFAAARGSFLFGEFCVADAFFAPVVSRLRSYELTLSDERAEAYAHRLAESNAYRAWQDLALAETHRLPYDELD